MNARSIAACAAACCLLGAGAAAATAHSGAHPTTPAPGLGAVRESTTLLVRPLSLGGPMGVAHLTQRGARVTGFVVMWGLEPGSTHANHLHGNAPGDPVARCLPESRRTTRHVADLTDLVADANGVAFGIIRERVTETAVRRGVYLMVHRDPTMHRGGAMTPGVNPPIACGNLS